MAIFVGIAHLQVFLGSLKTEYFFFFFFFCSVKILRLFLRYCMNRD